MNSGDNHGSGAPPPIVYLARRAARFWKAAAVVFLIAVVATVGVARQAWQPFRSETVLMYDQGVARDLGAFDPQQVGARLKDLLYASERMRLVIKEFHLFEDLSPEQAIEEVKKRVLFQMQPGATFSVAYTGFSPAEAQAVTQRLAQTLIADHDRERNQSVRENRSFLDAEQQKLEDDVKRKETALKEFLAQHPEAAAVANNAEPTGSDPAVVMMEQELSRLRGQLRNRPPAGKAGKAGLLRSMPELEVLRRQSEEERDKARRDLQDKLDTLTEAHPDVIVARERLKRAETDVTRFATQIEARAAATGETPATSPEDEETRRQIREIETRISGVRLTAQARRVRDPKTLQLGVQLQRLQHEVGEGRERLSRLEDRQVQANVAERMEASGNLLRLRVLDPATLPGSPVQSRKRKIAFIGFLVSCAAAAGTALAQAMLSDRIFDRTDIAQLAGAHVLAVVPRVPRRLRKGAGRASA
jgi:predicted RNase H-like nuclease (RuvC/YqgF family)